MRRRDAQGVVYKTPAQIDQMKEAGRLSAKVLRKLGEAIEPGVSTLELDAYAEKLIALEGGKPSFKGYGGFPGTICASPNEMVVHGIPSADVVLAEGDVLSIDTGATVNGWVGDNAWTFPVGRINAEKQQLLAVTEAALWAGIEQAVVGNCLGDIGAAIQEVAESHGFSVIREYVGHGIGRKMHEPPHVPNYGKKGRGLVLEPGLVIAIEPMIAAGKRKVHTLRDGWGVVTNDRRPAAHFEKTVAITENGPVIITAE